MGRRTEQTFFSKEEMWMGTRNMKILNIANHQGTTNQNHNEISHHTCHQKEYNRYWQGYGEKETLVHC